MARKKSWKSGEIKSMQTFSYQISLDASTQYAITINEIDTSKTIVPSTQSISQTSSSNIARNSRAHYLSNSTTVSAIARNSFGGGTIYSAGAGHVVEYY